MGYTIQFRNLTENLSMEVRYMATDKQPYSIATWYKGEFKSEFPIDVNSNEEAKKFFNDYIEKKFL